MADPWILGQDLHNCATLLRMEIEEYELAIHNKTQRIREYVEDALRLDRSHLRSELLEIEMLIGSLRRKSREEPPF